MKFLITDLFNLLYLLLARKSEINTSFMKCFVNTYTYSYQSDGLPEEEVGD